MSALRRRIAALAMAAALAAVAGGGGSAASAAAGRSTLTPADFDQLAIDQHPGAPLPLDMGLREDAGRPVQLGEFFHGVPVVLVLDYLRCPNLCGLVLSGLVQTLHKIPSWQAGRDYEVVAVSVDPRETPADALAAKARYAAEPGGDAVGRWHFLTGEPQAVARLADAVGFRYRYDPGIDQYAHAAGVTLIAPTGKVSRYILGLEYRPLDFRLGLTEASAGTVAAPASRLLLLCYGYDPQTGRYNLAVRNALRIGGLVVVLAIAVPVALALRRERRTGSR